MIFSRTINYSFLVHVILFFLSKVFSEKVNYRNLIKDRCFIKKVNISYYHDTMWYVL